jgi:glucosyl-3-phosphoglycerate synthase
MTVVAPASSLELLASLKTAAGVRVSVCIPARDEAATVAGVLTPVVALVGGAHALVDEVIVADDGSRDGTGRIAAALGARVVRRSAGHGKGAAMAEAARVAVGDIVVFLDADVSDFGAHFVPGLLEPLLVDGGAMLVKGYYRRPLDGVSGEGGRVTELLARPLLERLYPELAFVRQPLAGEVAIRRGALDGLVLEPGYGVEMGMLIDVARRYGPGAVAQVDLGERVHRNRPLAELSGQAREVLAAVLDRVAATDIRPLLTAAAASIS